MVSEMRLDGDGEASLFLDRSRTQVVLDLGQMPLELDRAGTVLKRWHGHESAIASLDMTTPGQAVMRLRASRVRRARSAAPQAERHHEREDSARESATGDFPGGRRRRSPGIAQAARRQLGGSVIEARLP